MEITDKCIFHGAMEERLRGVDEDMRVLNTRTGRLENFVIGLLLFIAAASSFSGYLLYEMPGAVSKKVESNAAGIAAILKNQEDLKNDRK
jgi:hypothetical protein